MYKVYMYTNTVNGKIYIGQTMKSLTERACKNGSNYKDCTHFYIEPRAKTPMLQHRGMKPALPSVSVT